MIQQIVRVYKPEGLDPSYPFRAATLRAYNLCLVSEAEYKKYKLNYIKIKRHMLRLPTVIFSELDIRKVASAFNLEEARVISGDRRFLRFWGLRDKETITIEVPVENLYRYHLKKRQPAFVYREEPVLDWRDYDKVHKFFQTEAGLAVELLPFEYFPVSGQVLKDWNVVFPDLPIPEKDPDERSGLFYYESF